MFYPGTIWIKRISKTLLLSSLTCLIYLQNLESTLMDKVSTVAENLEEILPEQETTNGVFSILKQSRNLLNKSDKAQKVAEFLNLPSTEELNDKQKAIDSLYTLNHLYSSILSKGFMILNLIGWLFLIPVLMAAIWMYQDLIRGRQQIMSSILILIAVGVNWFSYVKINHYLDIYLTQITI